MKPKNQQKEKTMKYNNVKDEEKKGRSVVPSKPVSINVEGGSIEGKFCGTQKRTSDSGDEYTLHIIEGKGIALDKATKKPVALDVARYGVFSTVRMARLMREVSIGANVKIVYLGMKKNEATEANPDAEGVHHDYDVLIMD